MNINQEPQTDIQISVIIPTRGRASNLVGTLEALFSQNFPRQNFEVIVSDDNSQDNTHEVVNGFKGRGNLKYIYSNVPKLHTWNASVPRNFGALIADPASRAFLFVDSDVKLPSEALLNYWEDFGKNPERVVIGPYDFYREGNENIGVADVRNLKFTEVSVDDTFDTVHDGLACFGGNILFPREIFWSVKGFSVDTHIGLEDGDMGLKLWKKGVKFSYDARTRGVHQWHETPTDRFPTNMHEHINALNQKHFHMDTSDVDKSMDLISASRDTYASWGITGWEPPVEWRQNKLDMTLKVKK